MRTLYLSSAFGLQAGNELLKRNGRKSKLYIADKANYPPMNRACVLVETVAENMSTYTKREIYIVNVYLTYASDIACQYIVGHATLPLVLHPLVPFVP